MWFINWMGESHLRSTWGTIRHIPLERLPFPDGVSNLDAWLKVMNWSKLKTLYMIRPTAVTKRKLGIAGALNGLKELKIDGMRSLRESDVDWEWETIVDFLEEMASTGTSLTSLSIRDISFPKMINHSDVTTEYKATEKLLGASLLQTNLTKLHLYDGMQFPSWGSSSQLPKQIPTLVSVLNSSSIEDLAIDMPSLPGLNSSNSDNGNWKIDGCDPKVSDEEMYKDFTPFIQNSRLQSVEFHVPAPECWSHQIQRVIKPGMYERSTEVEIREVDYRKLRDEADVVEVGKCERKEEELGRRTRRLFEWMNAERKRAGKDSFRKWRVVVGKQELGGNEGVDVEMLARMSYSRDWKGESGIWECWVEDGEEVVKCEGGRKWQKDYFWTW
ncbi:hypothetical protein EAE96_004325 [Botrytis aclada]|nr:hypothetical protein EAE96_004325 [Botrytis aclada]